MRVVDPEVIELEVFYDYFCPFVYRASVMLHNVGQARPLKVTWRYFSLVQVNSKDDGWTAWDAPDTEHVRGRLAFKAAEAARRQGRFDELHVALLQARHRDRLDLDQLEVVERVAVDAGLDLERFRKDVSDPGILGSLARDHQEGQSAHGVFGTPTLVFRGGPAAYVRLADAPEGTDAERIFAHLLNVANGEPSILEIKRPRKPAPD
jgi:predicted DsbA family dithiol-disulfide isomerase